MKAAAGGDPEAVEALLNRHLADLHAYVRLRASPQILARETPSDIVQSTCREVLENLRGFEYRGEGSFRHWLFTLVLHKLSDRNERQHAQKRDVRRETSLAELSDADLLDRYRSFCSPSAHAMAGEMVARIEAAFARLPDEYRTVIMQAKIVGLSRAQIASLTGRSVEAVRALLFRALTALAALLDEKAD